LTKISRGCDVHFTEIISSVISTLSEHVSVYFVYNVQCFEVIFYKTLRIHKNTNTVVFYLMFCHFSIHITYFLSLLIHLKLPFIPLCVIFPCS